MVSHLKFVKQGYRQRLNRVPIGWQDVLDCLPASEDGALTPAEIADIVAKKHRLKRDEKLSMAVYNRLTYLCLHGHAEKKLCGRANRYWRRGGSSDAR
ncbi:MAG: hypothetical protein QHG98_07255 [Methanothrix sp.]|jgi:hypothetical protein|nr:hypothetical protein [Methanothrix sp.]